MRARFFLSAFFVFVAALPVNAAEESKGGPSEFKRLQFRNIGPAAGGRVARACGIPGDPLTYYAATASGGVWKSTDGGIRWKSIFDDQPVSSIGSIAVAPSDPNVIYVGSGEANIRGNVQPGNGIYKSNDAGKTWKHVWQHEGQIGTMIVHPVNPDIAFAAVLGHAFGPNEERGVYRTTDGGKTWQRVLFKDRDTGASDVAFDPTNPRVLFAGLWQTRRLPWELTSGGPGSGVYVSRDGGDSWTQLVSPPKDDSPDAGKDAPKGKKYAAGLPEGIWGKICFGVAHNGKRIYAMIEAEKGGLFRSDDGGDSWTLINEGRGLRQRAWYFSTVTVHPTNPDVLYCPQVPLLKSIDGGKTFQRVGGTHHGDHHDIWIDPKNPQRMIDSNDGGVDVTTNGGETWYAPPLPISQFYHISVDNRTPYHVMGNMQDLGTASGPSNSLSRGGIRLSDWHPVGGGETGFAVPDPKDPNIVYSGEYGGYISRYDHRTRQARCVSIYPFNPSGFGAEALRYRFQWTSPILISPHDSSVVYHAANVLFRTNDGGETWKPISGDLTRNDKSKQKWSGGPITGDNTGVEVYGTLFALAESPVKKDLLWTGSDDGLVHVSHDAGKTWTNVTPKGLPEWATVICIEPSRFDAETAYVVVHNYRQDDMKPYLFATSDAGKTWKKLSDGLPQNIFLRVVREDPKRKGMLYLGTERGLAFSTDAGATWTPLKLNLPTVAVTDLVVKDNDLVVGTNGRSIWILDDLTPVREYSQDLAAKPAHLFAPQPAVRYHYAGTVSENLEHGTAQNPARGALLHYHLKEKPKGDLVLEILDDKGKVVRTLTSKEEPKDDAAAEVGDYSDEREKKPQLPTEAGLHRLVWDLHHDGGKSIKGAKVDSGNPEAGPLALPGKYTVKLTVAGQTQAVPLEVKLDPRQQDVTASGKPDQAKTAIRMEHLEAQLTAALKIRDDIVRLTRNVEQMRAVKKQLVARNALLKDDAKAEPLVKASKDLVTKMDALEEKFHNPKAKVVYDILAQKGGAQLYSQLTWLYAMILDGDGPPVQGWREVYEEQALLLKKYELEWQLLQVDDLAKLQEQAKKLEVPGVIVPPLEAKKQ